MIPLPRHSTINGIGITEIMNQSTIARIVQRIRNGGTEIVKLMKTGSAYYALETSTSVIVESILKLTFRTSSCSANYFAPRVLHNKNYSYHKYNYILHKIIDSSLNNETCD